MPRRQRAVFIVATLACASPTGRARAAEVGATTAETEPVVLTFDAPPGCPSAAQFLQELALRTERARLAAPGEVARRFVASVGVTAAGSSGRLEIQGTDGAVARREVTGHDCVEVTSALTLVAALAIDPQASLMPRAELLAGTTVAPEASPVFPMQAVPAPDVAAPPWQRPEDPTAPRAATPVWSLGAALGSLVGAMPSVALGGGAFVGFAPDADDPLVPSFRVGALAEFASPSFAGGIGADVSWWVSRLEACPLRPRLASTFAVELCAAVDAGVFHSIGRGLDHTEGATRGWLAPGAEARLVWAPAVGPFVEIGGGAVVPVRRYPLYYQAPGAPETGVWEMPRVAGTLALRAGWGFR
jgi:hypothetical protein